MSDTRVKQSTQTPLPAVTPSLKEGAIHFKYSTTLAHDRPDLIQDRSASFKVRLLLRRFCLLLIRQIFVLFLFLFKLLCRFTGSNLAGVS